MIQHPGRPTNQEVGKAMKEDIDPPKVVYLNRFKKRRLKINWPCATGEHPWDWKNIWSPRKEGDSPEKGAKEER